MTDNLRDAIEAAYDGVGQEAPKDMPPSEPAEVEPTTSSNDNNLSGEVGQTQEESEPEEEAPAHWANEDREVFKSLDTRGRKFLLRRHKQTEADYTKKLQAHAEQVKIAENYLKKITPHEAYIKTVGLDPLEAFDKLIGAEIKLRTGTQAEKQALFQSLAQQYGVQFHQSDTQPEIDEKTQFILNKLEQTEKSILQIKHEKDQAEKRTLLSHIQSFASQTDEKGLPKYPHFETIKADMGLLMQNGKAESLEDAYEKAIFLNKDLRNEYISRQNKEVEANKKTLASKNASFNVKSASSAKISDPKEDLNLQQSIERAYDAHDNKRRI